MDMQPITLTDGPLQRVMGVDREGAWGTLAYRADGVTFAGAGAEFTIHGVRGGAPGASDGAFALQARDFRVTAIEGTAAAIDIALRRDDLLVVAEYRRGPTHGTLRKRLSLTNPGATPVRVDAVDVEDLLLEDDCAEDDVVAPPLRAMPERDAQPVLGRRFFAGLEWPLARNWIEGRRLRTRQRASVTLAPGDRWTSRWATCGAARGSAAEAFVASLHALARYRGPGRSLYFDWLTHRSEGPDQRETALLLDLLAELRRAHGVRFDLFALDDGAVESRGGRYFRTYRDEHRARYPQGLGAVRARAEGLGLRLGVWLGPNDFGPPGDATRRRGEVAAMVRDWGLALLKLDTVVGPLLGDDPVDNERRLRALERMVDDLRAIEPELIILNHRLSASPYILGLLDTTLWEGAEAYVDVFAWNAEPRLWSRHAALGRGLPSYYGSYSRHLEDHGVCVNGFPEGLLSELIAHTFGRALLISPEVYGMLFTLGDDDLAALGKVCALAEDYRALLARPPLVGESSIARGDGCRAIVALTNDRWAPRGVTLTLDNALGLDRDAAAPAGYLVRRRFPHDRVLTGADGGDVLPWGARVTLDLAPFEATVVDIRPYTDHPYPCGAWYERGEGRTVGYTLPAADVPFHRDLGPVPEVPLTPAQAADLQRRVEALKFALSDDPLEAQALRAAAPSRLGSVQACRAHWERRIRRDGQGVAANAWDGDDATAWGDRGVAPYTSDAWVAGDNLWRVDLGAVHEIAAITLECTRGDALPCAISPDLATWQPGTLLPTTTRVESGWYRLRMTLSEERSARYLRIDGRSMRVRHLSVQTREDAVPTEGWRGTNCYGPTALPRACWQTHIPIARAWPGLRLAVVARSDEPLPDIVDGLFALVHDGQRERIFARRSPSYPFHAWESDQRLSVYGLTWVLDVTPDLVGRALTVAVSAHGPLPPIRVQAYLITDPLPWWEER